MMRLKTQTRSQRLPKSFPVGAVYVVEGTGGDCGRLSVLARYVVMPGGKRIEVPIKFREAAAAPARRHLRLVSSGRPVSGRKRFSRRLKKFVVAAGTPAQAAR